MQRICNKTEKPTAFYIFMSTLFHMRKMIQEYSAVTPKRANANKERKHKQKVTHYYIKKKP